MCEAKDIRSSEISWTMRQMSAFSHLWKLKSQLLRRIVFNSDRGGSWEKKGMAIREEWEDEISAHSTPGPEYHTRCH